MKFEDLKVGMTVLYGDIEVVLTQVRTFTSAGYSVNNPMNVFNTLINKNLKPVKTPKPTSVQRAIAADPSLFEQIVEHFKATGRIEISCQPSRIDSEADRLSQVSSLSPTEAVDYIKPTTEASHSAKFDIIVSDDIPESLRQFIGTFFKKGLRSGTGEFQINSRSLAEYLMQKHGSLPVKQAQEVV